MKRHQPALLGGLFIGVLSSLPVVNTANVCCCLWVVAGGVLVTYLQQQAKQEPIEVADAVLGGLIAGLIGAVITSLTTLAILTSTGAVWQDSIRVELEKAPTMTPEMREMIMNFITGRSLVLLLFALNLPMYAIFGMLGALLGVAIFRKKVPPAIPQG
jgi:hypothetical protein